MKKLLLSLLFSIITISSWAYDACIGGIYYLINSSDKTATVTYFSSDIDINKNAYTGDVVIPKTIAYNDAVYSVTTIGNYAFYGCTDLTSVEIPNSITTIGDRVFYRCTLTSITIPNSVNYMGSSPFNSADVKEVNISIDNVDDFVSYLGRTDISDIFYIGNLASSIHNILINGEKQTIITIPEAVTSIGNYAFDYCKSLTSVTIPNSVESIGRYAFNGCTGLTSVTIPSSVTIIGNAAFTDCSNVNKLIYAEGTKTVIRTFLTSIYSVVIPESVTSIGESAFEYCANLTSVTITNAVTNIGSRAFYGCYGLSSITIPNSVTNIDIAAFANCTGLTEITSKNPTPPTAASTTFEGVSVNDCTLHVPNGSKESYTSATAWKNFINIIDDIEEEKEWVSTVRGDSDGDGKVTMADVMYVIQYLLNGKFPD